MPYTFNRRQLLAAGLPAAGFLLAPQLAWSKTQIGSKTVSTLSDGHLTLPLNFIFPDVPQDELQALLSPDGGKLEAIEPPCNLTLLEDGERRVLFDAGSGQNFMPTAGKLGDALAEAGIDAETITDVIFTHAHPDHLWGIVDDFDEIAFPSAQLHFPRAEWDYWYDENTAESLGDARKTFAVGARNRLEMMEEQVSLFDAGAEVLPGVEAVDSRGHTPGHTSYVIHGGNGDGVMVVGDAISNAAVSFARPQWPTGSDQDKQQGIKTRVALLDRLATDKLAIVGYHLPDGGMGRVERDGTAYRFASGS